ncbi:siderophore-interacting protein [Flavobacterium sp. RHBU_24]|uniref:siderophore-interacting protein n=1 Tax=Flavobacterium sp. RHBU_24 TaxID=3391185 RepID=UPI0039848716
MPSAPKWLFDVVERLSPKLPSMVVTATRLLSSSVKKITFSGDFSGLDFREGYCIDFRVTDTEVRRYTPSFVDDVNGILELVVHLHGNAPGARFMDALQPGDTVNISAPRGHKYYDIGTDNYVIFGDETSLALACSFQQSFKKNRQDFRFYLELDPENGEVPALLGLENYTVFPKNGAFKNPEIIKLLPQLQDMSWRLATFILTGNVVSAQALRKALKGVAQGKVHLQGYWISGKKGL